MENQANLLSFYLKSSGHDKITGSIGRGRGQEWADGKDVIEVNNLVFSEKAIFFASEERLSK